MMMMMRHTDRHRPRRALATMLLAAALVGGAAPAWARGDGNKGQASATPAKQAQAHYDKAMIAYSLARFDEAIAGFSRAYELDPAPILLFNLGQAHWKKGDDGQALFFYRRFLEADPAADNRERVQARIRELEAKQRSAPPPPLADRPLVAAPAPAAAASAVPAAALATDHQQPRPAIYRRPWFWGAALGALAVVGVVTALSLRPGDRPWTCGPDCPTRVVE